jgi:tetratricopeptide (TPR) repeat protein
MIVKTFQTVFTNTSIWHVGSVDYVLIGTAEPAPVDLALLKARYEGNEALRLDLARSGVIEWPGLLGFFILGGGDVGRFADGAAPNTDDRLRLEFTAPRGLYLDTSSSNFAIMRRFRTADLPDLTPEGRREIDRPQARALIGFTDLWRRVWDDALAQFRRALELDPNYTPALVGTGESLLRLGRPKDGLDLAEKVLAREPRNVDALYLAGLASTALDDRVKGIAYLEQASALAPGNEDLKRALQAAERAPAGDPTRK